MSFNKSIRGFHLIQTDLMVIFSELMEPDTCLEIKAPVLNKYVDHSPKVMTNLVIKLEVSGILSSDIERDFTPLYDTELDNVTSVFHDICKILSEQPNIKFAISGFGQNEWPVDVKTDLMCVLEDMREIVARLSKDDYNFEFYLYEQGIERKLNFSSKDNVVDVLCTSYTDWQPNPAEIKMGKDQVKKIFIDLITAFCLAAKEVSPKVCNHQWYEDWEKSLELAQFI